MYIYIYINYIYCIPLTGISTYHHQQKPEPNLWGQTRSDRWRARSPREPWTWPGRVRSIPQRSVPLRRCLKPKGCFVGGSEKIEGDSIGNDLIVSYIFEGEIIPDFCFKHLSVDLILLNLFGGCQSIQRSCRSTAESSECSTDFEVTLIPKLHTIRKFSKIPKPRMVSYV